MNPNEIISKLIKPLPVRTRDILRKRFGLASKKVQTLQEIGALYNLTRERIRQIENQGLIEIKNQANYQPILNNLKQVFNQHSNIISEEKLFNQINPHKAACFFILHLDDNFFKFCENDSFKCHWTTDKRISQEAKKKILSLMRYLANKQEAVSKKEILNFISLPYLDISKLISENVFGEYGLVDWPEITPRGVKDKAYIILKQEQKPLHYKNITNLINQVDFSDAKTAYAQTVHNELIKDSRFTLEGRGIYFLRDAEKKRS